MSIFDSLASTSAAEPTQEEINEKKKKDSLNPEFYISGNRWASADEKMRPEFAGQISSKIRRLHAEDPKAKVLMKVEREGKVVDEEVPLFDDKGQPTAEGNDYFGKIDSYLQSAAADPNGGLELDPYTGKKRSVYQLREIREEPLRKPVQFGDVAGFEEDLKSGFDVGGEKDFTFARYARWRNEKTDRPIDANDLDAQKAFDAQKEFTEFDPSSFGPNEKMRMVGGFPKFNEKFLGDREGVKAEIVALEGVSAHRKNEFLQEFQIEAYKPVAARLQLEKDVFDSVTKNSRSSPMAQKALGDDKGQSRPGEGLRDEALNAWATLLEVIAIPIGGLTGNESRNTYERETFDAALGGGDLIAARDNELKGGGMLKGAHVKVMNELIERFQKEGITDGKEMGTIMRDTVKRNVWADGEEDKIRQLSNGELAYDPKTISARDPKEMHQLIESQNASKEQKVALKRDYDFRRSYFAKAVYDGPLADEDSDFKEWKAENKAKGITDPAKVLYSWKGLDTQFGGSYGWAGTTGNAIWDPLAGGGRGIANAGWSGSAMATTALSEGAGAIGLDRVSNWLKSGTVRAMEEIQENQALSAKDEALAGLRGERGSVRGVWNSTATSGVQMAPMFIGGLAGGALKAASGTNKGLQALGTTVQNLGVYGYAGVQGAQSIYEAALQKGEEKASLEGRQMSDDERYAVIQDNWIPALSNGVQTAMLTKLSAGSGVERMALGKAGAGGGGLTIKEILSQGRNVAQTTSSWKEALRSIKPEVVKVLKTFHADAKGEFIEETSNQVIEGFIKRASVDPDKSFNELAGESIMAGFQGSFLGGGIPAATSAFSFNDKKGHQEAIKYAMIQQYSDKIQADVAAGKPTVEEGSSEEMMKHFEFISEKTKDYNKLREEKNFTGALAVNDEIDAATKTVSEKFGLGEMDGKVWDRFNGNKSAPAMAAIFSNPNIEHKDKVELLLQAAKGESVLYSVNTEAPAAPPVSPSETTPIQSPSATNGEAKKEVVGDATWTLKAMGVDPGKNRVFKTSDHNPIVNDKGIKVEGGTLHSININGQPGAGAVLRSTDENGETVEQHVTAEKALALLPPNSMMNRNIKSDRTAYESSIQNHGTNINEWTEKQDGAGAGTNPEVAPPGEKGFGDPPSPKRVVDSEASGPSKVVPTSGPEPVASLKGVVPAQPKYPAPLVSPTPEQEAKRDAQVSAYKEWEAKYGDTHDISGRPKVSSAKEAPSTTPAVEPALSLIHKKGGNPKAHVIRVGNGIYSTEEAALDHVKYAEGRIKAEPNNNERSEADPKGLKEAIDRINTWAESRQKQLRETPPINENQRKTDAQREADAEAKRKRLLTEGAAGDSSPAASDLKLATAAGRLETVSKALSSLTGKPVVVKDKRPDSATYENNRADYKGDENVWSYKGDVFMSQGFLKGLEGMDKAKALQMLQDKAKAMGLLKETPKPSVPVVEASVEPEITETVVEAEVLDVVEEALTQEELQTVAEVFAEEDGFNPDDEFSSPVQWDGKVAKRFGERFADWMATGKEASAKLEAIFKKVWKAMKAASLAGVAFMSFQSGITTSHQQVQITIPNPSSLSPDIMELADPASQALINLPADAAANEVVSGVAPLASRSLDDPSIGSTPEVKLPTPPVVEIPAAASSMSPVGKIAYQQLYAALKDELQRTNKLLVITDKPTAHVFVFNPDGSLLLKSKVLLGLKVGDYFKGNTDIKSNRITPAGLFNLGLRDASRGGGEARTAHGYDFGKVFVLDKAIDGEFSVTLFHSVWLNESDASQRQAALKDEGAANSRYSFGCINLPKEVYKQLLDKHQSQMDGAKLFVVPDNTAALDEFLSGDTAQNKSGKDGLTRQSIPASDTNAVAANERRGRQRRRGKKETTLNATAASKTTDTSKSDLLSNTLTNSDPLAPVMSVGEDVLSGEAKPSYLKGTFTKDGDTYLYAPDKGTTLPLGMGSLVAVKGTDSVLSLVGVVNGDFVFRRVDFNRVVEMGGKGKRPINNVNSLSRNWNTTRIAAIAPKFLKLLPKISSGKLSESDARSLLNDVIKIIAPNRSIESIQEAELPGDQFFQAFSTPVEVKGKDAKGIIAAADGKFYKAVVGVRVDYKKLSAQLATLSQGHKSGNEDMDMLVAMDAARQMVSWMGEENIHTLTLDETHFPKPVMEKFFTDILSDKAHPFHDLLRITAKEQFPDIELSEADDTEGFAYTVASEMLRKLQQIRQTGSTSEINAAYARRLIEVINDKSLTGKVKATVELVKRFFERMRRILYLRQAMNQITDEQKLLLNKLNAAYLDAGFNEDVDDIKSKQTQEQALIAHTYFESTRLEIDKVAAKNSTPLMRLREVARDVFTNLGINVIHVDPDTGDMALDPAAAEYLQENHPLFDTKEINKALEELNDTESFRKSLTQSYFLSEVVKSRLEELDFNPTGIFDFLKGKDDYSVGPIYSDILAGSKVSGGFKESLVREALEEHIFQLQKAVDSRIGLFKAKLLRWFDAKDISSTKRIINLSKLGTAIGIQVDPSESNDPEMQAGTEKWRRWLQSQVSTKMLSVYDDAIAVIMKNEKFKGQFGDVIFERDVSVGQSTVAEALEEIERAKALLAASQQLSDEMGGKDKATLRSRALRMNEEASILDNNARAAGRNSSKEATVLRYKAALIASRLATDTPASQEKYDKFYRYMKALKDYNESVDGVLYRAIGRNNPDKREFGLDFRDTSFNINTIEDEKKGSPGNGSKAQPFGMQMPNPPAVTNPSDFAGYNINTPFNEKGTNLPGYGNPRMSKPTDTPEHRELWDNHYRQVFGNAKYRGRHAINWFLLQDALGNLPMDLGSRDDFMRTAGFNLAAEINDKLGIRFFENHDQAFPGLNLYDRLFTLLDTMKEENRANASMDFKQVIDIFSQTKAWANKIRSKVGGENFISEINGVPTLAGEAKVLLDETLKNFDIQMMGDDKTKGFEAELFALLDLYFRTKPTSTGVQYLENEKGLIKRDDFNERELYAKFKSRLNSHDPVGPQALMVQAMSSLNTSVKIVRKSLESFQDKKWQQNMEEEMDRTLNDYAYTPDHAELLALRDQKLDPSVVRQLSWTMRFHEKSAGYSVGSLHAYELLGERLKGEWNNDGRLLVTKLTRDREVGSLDQEGLGVSSVGDIENSGHMPLAFATGEQGNTRDSALNEKVGATQSTAAERNTRELMTPYQIQRHWLTRSLMFLGYGKGINGEGSANAAKDFAYDVIQQSEGTTRKGLHELMLRGLSGAFSMVYRNTPAFENLVEMFVEANPEWHYAFGEDSSVVFDESDRTVRFDPETFAADILMFKAKFETDALEKARISEKASVTEVMEALLSHATIDPTNDNLNLDNPNFNQGQEGRPSLNLPSEINERNATLVRAFKSDMGRDIKMGLYDARILESRKDLGDLVSPLEDTFVSGGLFVDNPALGVLLQNLTGGKVFVYVPSADAMKREGINHGVVTISHGDITLIVTPPGIASSQEEVKTAMRHALLHHATSSKESTSAINEMGARVREMFDPVFRTQQLLTGMQAQRDSIIDNATNHPSYKASKKQIDRLDAEVKAMVAKRIAEHLQKTARLFESNGLFMGRSNTWNTAASPLMNVPVDAKGRKSKKAIQAATRSAGGLVDTVVESNSTRSDKFTNLNENLQAQLEDNVDLITDILVDPKFKEMFDAAFFGTDEIDNNTLSDVHNLQLFGAIHGIRNTLESNEGFSDEKFPDESHKQAWNDDQQEEDERSAEEIENERIDRELSEDEAMRHIVASIADNLGGVMRTDGTLVLTEDSSVLPDAADLNQALKNLGALISSDSKRETKLFKLKGSEHVINPGDAALLNMLARVVASAKEKTSEIDLDSILVEGESPKRILNGLPSGEFGGAIIRPINRPSRGANNNSTPMGSWVNITRGAAHGRTAQTIAFAFMRQEKMRAALIAQLSSVQKSLDDLAKKRIAKDLMDQPDLKEHGNVFVDVAVDSAFIAEMDEATGGLVSKHIEETETMVADLRQAQSDQIAALEEIKRDIEQRLLPYESSENAVDAYIDSDLFEVEAAQELFDNLGNSIIESMNEGLYEGGELRAGRVISALVSKRLSPTGNLLLKAHREKAQRLLKEIQGKLELRRSGFTTGDKKNFKDKHIESLVKDFNETIDTLMKGVNTVVREGFGQVDMASAKVDLPRPRLVWNDGLADNAISDAIRAMGRIASPQAVADVVKDVMLSRTTQAAAEKFGRGKGSREFTEQIAAIVKAYDTDGVVGMKKMFTEAMDSLANKDFDISGGPGKASGMRALLKGLILNNDEVVNMLKDGVKLPSDVAEIEAMKQLQRKIESSLKETSESLKKISETKDSYQMGRYHHDIKAGLEKSDWDPKSTKKRFEIAPTDRQVPVTMNLVPDNYNPIHQTGDSLQQEKLRFLQEEDDRFDFYAKREGVMRALSEFTDGRLEEAYKRVRGSAENFSTFNPFAMIKQALKLANIEKMIMDEREAGAKTLAERVAYRGMTVEAIAAITGGDFYTVSEDKPLTDEQNRRAYFESPGQPTNRQKRVAFYKSPQGFGERMKLAGHLFDDGKPILLMAQDARTQLMEQFPDVTKHNVDSVLKEQVLNALTVKRAVAKKRITDSYMLEFDKGYIKGDFDPTGYRILAGQTKVSRQDAAKVFVSNFVEKIQAFVEDRGKNPLAGLKDANGLHVLSDTEKLSMDHDNVKKVIALYSNMIEKIVYAQGHKLLDDDASRKVRNFLLSISESEYKDMNDPENVLGGFANNDNSMQQFDLMGTFATVFSAIEGDVILRRLAVGLSSPTITGKLGLGNLRLLHGQDSRIRSRFIKDAAAHDTAIHLQAFLEQGFDGQTGREGAEAQSQWINRKIADSLKTIGNNSLDHAIAKDIATLEGIKHNRGMGVKAALEKFHDNYTKGFKNLLQYDLAQRDAYRRIGSKFFNSKHIQLTDDIPMAKEKDKLLSRGLNEVMVNMMSSGNTSEENDQQAIDLIDSMIADLLKGRKNADKIKAHAELVEKEMRSISDAMAISRAVLSHGAELAGAGEMTNEWKHDPVTAFEQSYTSVPLSFSYAAAPGVETSMTKGQYISDPALLTSLSNGAIYGGPGKFAGMMNQGRIIYRPLQVNGITSINSLVEDSVYRMNVAPSYEVLRRLVGRTESPRGIPTATDSKMLNDAQMRGKVSHTTLQTFNNSLAAVATELESNLQNDSQSGVDSTRFARVMELETARFIWKALGSPWQLVNQSLGPSLAVIIKKLVTLQGREAYDFVTVLTKIIVSGSVSLIPDMVLSDQRAFKNFNSRIRNFNHDVSIYTNKQGMDGIDNTKNVTRNQLSHGSNPLMKYGGFALNKFQSYTEGYLDNTIGAAERTVGRAVFAMEMMSELRKAKARGEFSGDVPKNVDELIKLRKQDIPTLAKARARIKVSDMLGQGDNAKKAEMFQNHTTSPTVTALVKSLSRFSSQTASTAGNMQVFAHGLFSPGTDFQTRLDAFENIVGTLTQNLLFNTLKVKTAVPLFAFLFNTLIGGDDEERAAKKAQEFANDWLNPSKEGLDGDFSDIFKSVVLGPKSEFFRMSKESGNKTKDAAIGTAFAGLLSKSLVDGLTMTPLFGAGLGYSSVSDLAQRFVTNNAAEHVLASRWFMDMKVAKNYWDTNKIGIPEYDKGFMQTIADLTSPSADVYNTGKDVIQLYEGFNTRRVTPWELAMKTLSIAVPVTPEFNKQVSKELKEKIRDATPKKDRP